MDYPGFTERAFHMKKCNDNSKVTLQMAQPISTITTCPFFLVPPQCHHFLTCFSWATYHVETTPVAGVAGGPSPAHQQSPVAYQAMNAPMLFAPQKHWYRPSRSRWNRCSLKAKKDEARYDRWATHCPPWGRLPLSLLSLLFFVPNSGRVFSPE